MNSKCLLLVALAFLTLASARPKHKNLNLGTEAETETKIREKRKYEIPLLKQLEESGVGVKKEPTPTEEPEDAEEPAESKVAETENDVQPEVPPPGVSRVKKQSPNNLGCGKTVCGPLVSARGSVVNDVRGLLHGSKPVVTLGDLTSPVMSNVHDAASKLDRLSPLQGRTVDTIVTPIALGTMGYGAPASYGAPAPTLDLAHSFFKPPAVPAVPTVPAVAVIAAPHPPPPNPLLHLMPHLMPHLLPHLMPSLMSNLGSYFTPARYEPIRYPEVVPADVKQPVPSYPAPTFGVSGDNTLLCQPYRNQRIEGPYDYFYKPDAAVDKSINVTDGSKRSQNDMEEDRKIYEHLRKVNEIKDEISQLNRAAQRIVDQQERLTAMQQKQLWGNSGHSSSSQTSEHMNSPYMGSGYYTHPSMPWGYSRSNILSYPRSSDDIDFFINLMRAGKKMGLISDLVQPSVLSTLGDAIKGVTDGGKTQKDATDGISKDEGKVTNAEKKPIM